MKLTFQIWRLHIFFSCQHLVCISTNGIDLAVMYHKTVGMCSLPAWIGVSTESGVYHGNGRLIIRTLKILKECTELTYQKHTFVYNGTATHGNYIGIIIALFKLTTCNIKHSVKSNTFFHLFWLFDKCLHNTRHTFSRLMTQNFRDYRNSSPAKKLQPFFFDDDLEHLFRLGTFDLMLWEEELGNTIFSFVTDLKALFLTGFFEKFMGNLQKDSHTVTGFSFRIFTCPVLQMLYDTQCIGNCIMSLFAFDVDNCTDTTVVMFKFLAIQTLIFFHHFLHIPYPFCVSSIYNRYYSLFNFASFSFM